MNTSILAWADGPGGVFDFTRALTFEDETISQAAIWPKGLILGVATILISLASLRSKHANACVSAFIAGSSWPFVSRVQFFLGAEKVIAQGYYEVKNGIYKLCGGEMLVLPNKYVEELRRLPESKASAIQASIDGVYSATDVLAESDLHSRVIQRRLTPKLNVLVPILRNELNVAMMKEFPDCTDDRWTSVQAFPVILYIISRLASRLFVGAELCRDEEWLEVSRGYTESVFRSVIFLRLFPGWLKPIMSFFSIYSWRIARHLRKAKKMLVPEVLAYRGQVCDDGSQPGSSATAFDNLLKSMNEVAAGIEREPEKLAQRTLILTLASSHTTSMAACQALFDICAHPQYIPDLRAEIQQALAEDGCWRKTTLTKLRKLDSFIKESQRFNPPSLLGFKRAIFEPLTLSDGLKLPKGAHVLMAINHIQFEDPRLQEPATFDGLRYYHMRQQPEHTNRLQFATTDEWNLHFGHGAHACPGRFLAANVIKLLLAHLLVNFDFCFPEGQGRPPNIPAHEYSFPNPEGIVQFRAREQCC